MLDYTLTIANNWALKTMQFIKIEPPIINSKQFKRNTVNVIKTNYKFSINNPQKLQLNQKEQYIYFTKNYDSLCNTSVYQYSTTCRMLYRLDP